MECFIFVTVLWIFSVCLHEFGHAWAAYRGGDHTVKDKGYLTLNPLHYAHPVYSLLMPVLFMVMGGIGLPGGAVYIERDRLRSRAWNTWVSLAGPAMNLPFILLIGATFKFGLLPNDPERLVPVSLALLLQLEIGAVLLNLIPVPPLDGFQAIAPWLPPETRQRIYASGSQAMIILIALLFFVPPVYQAFWNVVNYITLCLGVDPEMAYVGWREFRFWERP
jgi:Zn-dependent protease